MHWHSDSSYEAEPASVTMLYALEAPACGNETLFADMVAAYDALPAETKARIDSLQVIHVRQRRLQTAQAGHQSR